MTMAILLPIIIGVVIAAAVIAVLFAMIKTANGNEALVAAVADPIKGQSSAPEADT